MTNLSFADRLIQWQKQHGRHHLPWQGTDPYHVWVSEIMLQQTQVKSVLLYYPRFLACFPTIAALAGASQEEVLALWSGLGYYSRARNLHKAAKLIMTEFNGRFPTERTQIEKLPGIGRSTAAAIASFVFKRRESILDGNVKRLLTRYLGISGYPGEKVIEQRLWLQAEALLPENPENMPAYTQGLMDLGALVCRRSHPDCQHCPLNDDCFALQNQQTDTLPTRKPKKPLPTRHTFMVITIAQEMIWLIRRPSSGIWGGLLSLPEFDTLSNIEHWLSTQEAGEMLPALPDIEHIFSHYRLIITPIVIQLKQAPNNADWEAFPITQALEAGIPAPVKRLLLKLDDDRLLANRCEHLH